jgi:hypothetical protein
MKHLAHDPVTYRTQAGEGGPRFKTIVFTTIEQASDPYPFGEPVDIQLQKWNPETGEMEVDLEGVEIYGKINLNALFGVAAFSAGRVCMLFASVYEAGYYFGLSPSAIRSTTAQPVSFGEYTLKKISLETIKPIFEFDEKIQTLPALQ